MAVLFADTQSRILMAPSGTEEDGEFVGFARGGLTPLVNSDSSVGLKWEWVGAAQADGLMPVTGGYPFFLPLPPKLETFRGPQPTHRTDSHAVHCGVVCQRQHYSPTGPDLKSGTTSQACRRLCIAHIVCAYWGGEPVCFTPARFSPGYSYQFFGGYVGITLLCKIFVCRHFAWNSSEKKY